MNSIFILVAILLPIAGGIVSKFINFKSRRARNIFIEAIVILTSALVFLLIFNKPTESLVLISFAKDLTISFKIDGLGQAFGGMIAFLWPFATLYAFEYMKKEEREPVFFMFYTITFGVTLGISFAEDLMTMYFFYEMLTLVTVPLVLHTLTRKAILASRTYLYYSLGGAAFGFLGMIFAYIYSININFTYGGNMDFTKVSSNPNLLLLIYCLTFLGFGVKAAIFPFNKWLPQASVAPTPVTALLHAVAVVKSGAFAIMRITYYTYGPDFLRGTWAQYVCMGIALLTILYGCSRAIKETHFKRRLAYSTIGNLSYILFGVTLMNPLGLLGALCHMIFHAIMKITSFFAAGAVITQTGRQYVHELDGLGKKMPVTFLCFTVSSLALMGVPGMCGFISKYKLADAALNVGGVLPTIGVVVLLISSILTAVYMLTVTVRAYFVPEKVYEEENDENTELEENTGKATLQDPTFEMLLPMCLFAILSIVIGIYSKPILEFLTAVSFGNM